MEPLCYRLPSQPTSLNRHRPKTHNQLVTTTTASSPRSSKMLGHRRRTLKKRLARRKKLGSLGRKRCGNAWKRSVKEKRRRSVLKRRDWLRKTRLKKNGSHRKRRNAAKGSRSRRKSKRSEKRSANRRLKRIGRKGSRSKPRSSARSKKLAMSKTSSLRAIRSTASVEAPRKAHSLTSRIKVVVAAPAASSRAEAKRARLTLRKAT